MDEVPTSQPVPDDRSYTAEHEWVVVADGVATVGITRHAADQLGDVVFLDLPAPGVVVAAGRSFGEIESTKSVSDLFAPVGGTVVARNDDLDTAPETVNRDPYGAGWLVRIAVEADSGPADLLDAQAYRQLVGG